MPILDWDPGQSPEAPGTLTFFEQGSDPSTGFVVSSRGVITLPPGGGTVTGDQTITGALTVSGFTALQSAQTAGDFTSFGGNGVTIGTAGAGVRIKEGANARMGTSTLVAGTVVVATNKVTATSRIFLTTQAPGGAPGAVYVSARTAGTSFTVTSTSGTDTSLVGWLILEPAP